MTSQGPEVCVVVATRNRAERLRLLLDSLRSQSLPRSAFEVVVVDDGSTDGTPGVLGEEAARGELPLRLVRQERSEGVAAARNAGWRAGAARLVAFVDDDCVADPGWLAAGLAAARQNDGVALVQGRTEPMPDELPRLGPFSRTLRVDAAGPTFETCNIFYPRSLLERVGGFDDEAFPAMGGADTDLGWRAIEAGATPVFAGDARVFHAVSRLGPIGKLRVAARWGDMVQVFARHAELRRELTFGVFWKGSHYLLFRALVALVLPRRLWPLRGWLAYPYLLHLLERGRIDGGGPLLAPYYALHDLVELGAVARGSLRHRTLVL